MKSHKRQFFPHGSVGILAFQGGFIEHEKIIQTLGHTSTLIRSVKDLDTVDSLIIPGGESTTIGFFLEESGLLSAIKKRASEGLSVWGTCAGAILLAKKIMSDKIPPHLGLLDIEIERNGYGRQIQSFRTELTIDGFNKKIAAAFIRAPIIKKTSPEVKILATYEGNPVLVRQNNILASTFHPELCGEARLHNYFLSMVCCEREVTKTNTDADYCSVEEQ